MAPEKSSSKGQTWLFCTTGLPSDIVGEVDDMTFHLHKFPLMSMSKKLNDLISEQVATMKSAFLARGQDAATTLASEKGKQKEEDEVESAEDDDEGAESGGGETDAEFEIELSSCYITLPEFPGGSEAFEVAVKFCYGVKIDLSAANVAALRCASEVLEMTEEYSEDNLISCTGRFLSQSIDAIYSKAALVDPSLFGWSVNESACAGDTNRPVLIADHIDSKGKKPKTPPRSNAVGTKPWFEDLTVLCYNLFNRILEAMNARDVSPDVIENCLLHITKRCFPGISCSSRKSGAIANASAADKRELLESIVVNLPTEKCSSSSQATRTLFRLLRTTNILSTSEHCKRALERKIGAQLEQATLDDLLILSYSYLNETLYDVLVQFM